MNASHVLTPAGYNRRANDRVLRRIVHRTPDELRSRCWLSRSTVLRSLLHLVDAEWFGRLACQTGEAPAHSLTEEDVPDGAAPRSRIQQEDARWIDFVSGLSDGDLDRDHVFRWTRARPRTRRLWILILHAFNHGTHRRAEVGQRLGELERTPGDLDPRVFASRTAHAASASTGGQTW